MFGSFSFCRGLCTSQLRTVRSILILIVVLFSLVSSLPGSPTSNAPQPAHAASTIIVTELAYSDNQNGRCNLFEAVRNAYDDARTYSDCAMGNGVDTIIFTVEGTIRIRHINSYPSGWDMIIPNGTLIIDGQGKITLDGQGTNMIADVPIGDRLILKNLTLQNGYSEYGGAVRNFGRLEVERCTFRQNTAETMGGAIFSNDPNAEVIIEDSTFNSNQANRGGAIFNDSGQLSVVNSTFNGNSVSISGGGIQNNDDAAIINSTFVNNSASNFGAGVHNQAGSISITYSTFANNSASNGSGFNNGASAFLAGVLFSQGASGSNCRNAGSLVDNGYNFSDDGSCQTFTGTSQRNVAINLRPLADNGGFTLTRKPSNGSIVIGAIPHGTFINNHGERLACNRSTNDQTGTSRPIISGDACTSGAVEVTPVYDFGDAPDPTYPTLLANNGARHIVRGTLMLGSAIDNEPDGQPQSAANGDDNNGNDDEDGVSFITLLRPNGTATIAVTVTARGLLNAWIDFNADGDWTDPGERIFADQTVNAGTSNLSFTVPAGAAVGDTFARFRFDSAGGLSYTGLAADGEVEDYQVTIEPPPSIHVNPTRPVNISETGPGSRTFTFTLGTQPLDTVTIPISVSSGECTITAGGSVISLNGATWDTGYTVTVTAVDDALDDGNLACDLATGDPASTNDAVYNQLDANDSPDVAITIIDNDAAGIYLDPTGPLTLSENGPGAQTFTFKLNSQPTDTVTIPVSVSGGECALTGGPTISLDATTWDTGYEVTVTAVDDALDDGNLACDLATGDPASTNDTLYNQLDADDSPEVAITIIDDDTAGIYVDPTGPLTLSENGPGAQTFTFKLNSQPTDTVTIPVSISSGECTLTGGPAISLDATTWDTGYEVTVTAVDDLIIDGDHPCNLVTGDPVSTNDTPYDSLDATGSPDVGITIINNDVPVAADNDVYATDEDIPLTVDAANGVLSNDTGGNGQPFSAVLENTAVNGVLVFNADGSFTYTPNAGFFGVDSFTYHATDGTNDSATATVTINVALVNGETTARDDSGDGRTNAPITINVLNNDFDPDGDSLHIAATSAPANGHVTVNGDAITYVSNPGFAGIDSFSYTVADDFGGQDIATVTVIVWQPVPLCADFDGSTNEIIRANVPGGTITDGSVFCRVLVENQAFIRQSAEIGKPEVLGRGVIQAVDVFALLHDGRSTLYFNNEIAVCLQGSGAFLYLDGTVSPRQVIELPVYTQNGYTCANVPNAGTVVLVGGAASATTDAPVRTGPTTALSNCMVTTRDILNLREQPNGDVLRMIPYEVTLTALERAAGWFYVDYNGQRGWISASYVTPQGVCGQ